MSNSMIKMGPLAGFLAVVAYCVWPLIWPTATTEAEPEPLPEIEDAWLRPGFKPPAARDPFRPPGDPSATRPTTAVGAPTARKTATRTASSPRPAEDGPAPGFRLGGTLVAGDRRLAIIDGRVYRQGELVEADDPAAGGWRVDRVEAGRVLLSRPRRRTPVMLEFSDPLAAMAEAPAAVPRRPAGAEGLDVRSSLAEAGIPMPAGGILEQLADRSGGTVPGAYRALLNLLASPPRLAEGMGTGTGSEGGESR